MKVTVNNKLYKVYWQHEHPRILEYTSMVPKKDATPFIKFYGSTSCTIEEWETYEVFSNGHAYCAKNDQFNKSKGRIVSLTKAIKHLPKDVRKQFWDVYKKEINFR